MDKCVAEEERKHKQDAERKAKLDEIVKNRSIMKENWRRIGYEKKL